MKKAAIGFRAHSGWSAAVVVSIEKGKPKVLRRERVQLVKTFSYKFRQPYHTGEKIGLHKAGKFIAEVRKEAEGLATGFLRAMRIALDKEGYGFDCGGIVLASGRSLPELEKILASHALIHSADGELFREAICRACERSGIWLKNIRGKELVKECGKKVYLSEADILQRVSGIGKPLGAPWGEDEKFAAMAAWMAL